MINYIQCDRHPKNSYDLDIKDVDYKGKKKRHDREEARQMINLDLGDTPEKLKGDYLDM